MRDDTKTKNGNRLSMAAGNKSLSPLTDSRRRLTYLGHLGHLGLSLMLLALAIPLSAAQQPAATEAKFFSTPGDGTINYLSQWNWGRNWHQVLPLRFPGRAYDSLLFYDRSTGRAKLFHTTGNGALSWVRTYNWSTNWDRIVTIGQCHGGGRLELFFYDRDDGRGKMFSISDSGALTLNRVWTSLDDWDVIKAGRFYGGASRSLCHDVLFYSREQGLLNPGRLKIQEYDPSISDWAPAGEIPFPSVYDDVLVGQFVGDLYDDVIFVDHDFPRFVGYQGIGNGALLEAFVDDDLPASEHLVMVAGELGGSTDFDDLLIYDGPHGHGEFRVADGTGTFTTVKEHTTWRDTWSRIVAGKFASNSHGRDDLLFYDHSYLIEIDVVQLAEDDGSHPLIISQATRDDWERSANEVFRSAGMRFQFNYQVHNSSQLRNGNLCNNDTSGDKTEANRLACDRQGPSPDSCASSRKSHLTVFVFGTSNQPNCSGWITQAKMDQAAAAGSPHNHRNWGAQYVAMHRATSGYMLAHELGHFFGLLHTFQEGLHGMLKSVWEHNPAVRGPIVTANLVGNWMVSEGLPWVPLSLNLDAAVSDPELRVLDTPPDPGPHYWTLAGIDRCPPLDVPIAVMNQGFTQFNFNPNRSTPMTYYDGTNCRTLRRVGFTRDQTRLMRDHLLRYRRRLIEP